MSGNAAKITVATEDLTQIVVCFADLSRGFNSRCGLDVSALGSFRKLLENLVPDTGKRSEQNLAVIGLHLGVLGASVASAGTGNNYTETQRKSAQQTAQKDYDKLVAIYDELSERAQALPSKPVAVAAVAPVLTVRAGA